MRLIVEFRSSDAFLENHGPSAVTEHKVNAEDFVQLTYRDLRIGPDGETIAQIVDGDWYLASGGMASDVTIYAA